MEDFERMRLKKQQQKAQRREKKAAKKQRAAADVPTSEALRRVRMLCPGLSNHTIDQIVTTTQFSPFVELSNDDWEQLGCDLAACTKLHTGEFNFTSEDAMNQDRVDQSIISLLGGWEGSSSLEVMGLWCNELRVGALRSVVPFWQNCKALNTVRLNHTRIPSQSFNELFRALQCTSIEKLYCMKCGIKSIQIDNDSIPGTLTQLQLDRNKINDADCRELVKLLQGDDAALRVLTLEDNDIGEEGIQILADELQHNTSLEFLDIGSNEGLTKAGAMILLKLVCDVSSIDATLQTNSTLIHIDIGSEDDLGKIQNHISFATGEFITNQDKVIEIQLHSKRRAKLCRLQGIDKSNAAFYGEFNPLHLPEILALIANRNGHGLPELYVALKSSIAALFSTVDKLKCLEQKLAFHQGRVENLQAQIVALIKAERNISGVVGTESHNKRRRI